ncbi:MAG: Maf family protein [Planctomycetota bacterium]
MGSTDRRPPPRLILASGSPRRRELLAAMGYAFEVLVPRVDESVAPGADAAEAAERLAVAKAEEAARRAPPPAVIVAADTLCALRGRVIGKPADRDDARRILRRLSGTRHHVITGLCVLDARSGRRVAESVATAVVMKPMTDAQVREYVESGEADGKAGAYAIQETGDRYVARIEGSFDNVVGLPTERLAEILAEFGLPPPAPGP